MLCKACNEIATNNFIKCDCGLYLHYECLYKYNVLPNDYTNISQSKYAIHILKSPSFKFTCKSCSLNGENKLILTKYLTSLQLRNLQLQNPTNNLFRTF